MELNLRTNGCFLSEADLAVGPTWGAAPAATGYVNRKTDANGLCEMESRVGRGEFLECLVILLSLEVRN